MHKCICCGRSSVTLDGWQVLAVTNYDLCPECTDCPYNAEYMTALLAGTVKGNNPNCRLA